jgi:hypothetical protein
MKAYFLQIEDYIRLIRMINQSKNSATSNINNGRKKDIEKQGFGIFDN